MTDPQFNRLAITLTIIELSLGMISGSCVLISIALWIIAGK